MNEKRLPPRDGQMTRALRLAALAAVALAIFQLLFPFLEAGYRNGHDIGAHVTYTYLFDDAVREGQFPVRWIEGPGSGFSQPLFNFYQVGFYYLVELVHLFVPRLSQSLTLTVGLLWWTGAGFMFLWLKRLGSLPAGLGALMFALSPYMLQDAFVRAAYPEFAALAIAPAVLWSLDRLLTTGRVVFVPVLAVLLGVMIVCHLPATVILSPLLLAVVVHLFLTKQAVRGSTGRLAAASALALGLSAFYVIPALIELEHIHRAMLVSFDQDYHGHFVLAKLLDGIRVENPNDVNFQLGISQWIVVLVGPLFVSGMLIRRRFQSREVGIAMWLAMVGLALFMMNAWSTPVWEALRFLSFIQYPWRFLLLVSIACAATGAFLLTSIRDARVQAAIVLVAVGLHLPLYFLYQRPERLILRDELNIDDPDWRHTKQARLLAFYYPAYDPIAVTDRPKTQTARSTIVKGRGTLRVVSMRNDELTLDAHTDAGMQVSINSHYFPGWGIRLDGPDTHFVVSPGEGFMLVDIPPGDHRVEARFGNTPIRTFANTIALVAAVLVFLLWMAAALGLRGLGSSRGSTSTVAALASDS